MDYALYCCTLVPLMAAGCVWCVYTLVTTMRDVIADLREDDPIEVTATKAASGTTKVA